MIIYLYIFACRWRTILCSPVLKINKKYECEERFNTQKNLYSRCEYSNRTGVRTKQLNRDPAEEVVSVRIQMNSGMVEWMNKWMNDIKHTWGFA